MNSATLTVLATCISAACTACASLTNQSAGHAAAAIPATTLPTIFNAIHVDLNERDAWKLAKQYTHVPIHATDGQLKELCRHPDVGVALAAGWEIVRRSAPQGENVCADWSVVANFLKLVRDRTGDLPDEWALDVLHLRFHGDRSVYFRVPSGNHIFRLIFSSGMIPPSQEHRLTRGF